MHLQDAMHKSLYHLPPMYLDAHGLVCLENSLSNLVVVLQLLSPRLLSHTHG